MLFSIIIPVYNRAEKVKPTLDSVLAQSYRPLQVVLVDNCSSDHSLKVLKDFQRLHDSADFEVVVTQETHHTASATRNRGFCEAKGDWVLFFDSDDTMRPNLVEEYARTVRESDVPLDIVALKACLHSRNGVHRYLPFFTSDPMANHILHSVFATQRYAVRREYFAQYGMWNKDILQWDDWELGVRLMLGNPHITFLNKLLVDIYDSGEASITGVNFHGKKGSWEQAIDEAERQVVQSQHPEKWRMLGLIEFRRIVLAAHYSGEGFEADAQALYLPALERLSGGSAIKRGILKMLYAHTRRGYRGASRMARHLITNQPPVAVPEHKLFTIIIPVYNRCEKVKATLDSVLAQSHRPLQVVLVDNCSSDGTLQVLRDFQARHSQPDFEVTVLQEHHHTAPAARNCGFKYAKGEWVMFFDSDDTMQPSLVAEYNRTVVTADEPLDMIITKVKHHSSDGKVRVLPFFTTDLMANHILHSVLATQRYAVRREFFDAYGGWNSDFYEWNDWELGIRLLLGAPKKAFIHKALIDIYYSGEASITGTNFYSRKGRWERVLDEAEIHLRDSLCPDKERMLRLVDFRRLVLAAHYAKEQHPADADRLYRLVAPRLMAGHPLCRHLLPLLYRHVRKGRRGASHIARHLLR